MHGLFTEILDIINVGSNFGRIPQSVAIHHNKIFWRGQMHDLSGLASFQVLQAITLMLFGVINLSSKF